MRWLRLLFKYILRIKMKIRSICIFALVLFFSVSIFAQTKPTWIASLEETIKQREDNLKIQNVEERQKKGGYDFVFEFDDFRSNIQITKFGKIDDTPENLFATDVDLYSQAFGKNSKRDKLKNFGDEGYIWANIDNKGWTRISFRKGKIFVNVFTSSENLARRLAQYVAEKIPKD